MKNLMLKVRKFVCDPRTAMCFALCLVCSLGFAQEGVTVLTEAENALRTIVENVISLLRVVLGLGALVTLVIVIFKLFKGDREAAEKIAWWVAGLTLGFVLLSVVGNLIR